MSKERFDLKLEWSQLIAPNVRHFAFSRVGGDTLSFIPGQFINLHWTTEAGDTKRSYSIASRISQTTEIELAASLVEGGFASERLVAMAPGDIVSASGPYGRLILPEDMPNMRLILVATGTGVTPYRAMLDDIGSRITAFGTPVVILQGVQTHEQLLYGDEFLEFADRYPQLQFRAYYSRAAAIAPHEYNGYVQSAFTDLKLDPARDIVYLCGNPNMIDDAFAILKECGFSSSSVRREKYISGK